MRLLERNKSEFWYSLYNGKTDVVDADGFKTGEKEITYTAPRMCRANISPATGVNTVEMFGTSEQYDKVIVLDAVTAPPIDENTVLCVDKPPTYDADDRLLYDYVVKRVARSLNYVSIAISKVSVS